MYKDIYEVSILKDNKSLCEYITHESNRFEAMRKVVAHFLEGHLEAQTDADSLAKQVKLADARLQGNTEYKNLVEQYFLELGFDARVQGSVEGYWVE